MSPILIFTPKLRQIHQEQAESSKPQGNNAVVMEMLRVVRQEMQEKDNQLEVQQQLRDEYMDVELKRRDKNHEEALRL